MEKPRYIRILDRFPTIKKLARSCYDFVEFACDLTGYIPSHCIRLFLYRHIFKVKIGVGTSIHYGCRFYQPNRVTIGKHCIIGHCCFLDGRETITIGNNVNLAGETEIFTLQHDPASPDFGAVGGPVVLEDYVFSGTRTTLLPNITIGKGAGIAAGAVVTKDVEEYTIVGGIPARKIGERCRELNYVLDYAKLFH